MIPRVPVARQDRAQLVQLRREILSSSYGSYPYRLCPSKFSGIPSLRAGGMVVAGVAVRAEVGDGVGRRRFVARVRCAIGSRRPTPSVAFHVLLIILQQ